MQRLPSSAPAPPTSHVLPLGPVLQLKWVPPSPAGNFPCWCSLPPALRRGGPPRLDQLRDALEPACGCPSPEPARGRRPAGRAATGSAGGWVVARWPAGAGSPGRAPAQPHIPTHALPRMRARRPAHRPVTPPLTPALLLITHYSFLPDSDAQERGTAQV